MEACQSKAGARVIERGAGPISGGVTYRTVLWEAGGFVGRIGGVVVIGLVAIPARATSQAEVIVGVALGALQGRVETGECEACSGVVELRVCPHGRVMAHRAVPRKAGSHMVGAGGLLEIGQMAAHALRRRVGEDAVDVTLIARQICVRPG